MSDAVPPSMTERIGTLRGRCLERKSQVSYAQRGLVASARSLRESGGIAPDRAALDRWRSLLQAPD